MDKLIKILKDNWKVIFAVLLTIVCMLLIKLIVDIVIPWSNKNQGFIMLLMMLVYTVTILVIAGRGGNSARLLEQRLLDRQAPAIVTGLRYYGDFLSICLRNEGSTSAAVELKIDQMQSIADYYKIADADGGDSAARNSGRYMADKLDNALKNRLTVMPGQELVFELLRRGDNKFVESIKEITISCSYFCGGTEYKLEPAAYNLISYFELG